MQLKKKTHNRLVYTDDDGKKVHLKKTNHIHFIIQKMMVLTLYIEKK